MAFGGQIGLGDEVAEAAVMALGERPKAPLGRGEGLLGATGLPEDLGDAQVP